MADNASSVQPPGARDTVAPREAFYTRQKYWFALVFTIVSVLPLLVLNYNASRVYRQSWVERTGRELTLLVADRREIVDNFLTTQEDQLAGFVSVFDPPSLRQGGRLATLLAALSRGGAITDVGIIAANGDRLADQGPFANELAGRNYRSAPWFSETMRSGRYVSDVFAGDRKMPHLVVAVADPARQWILRATIDLGFFHGLLASANVGPDGDAFIVNRRGEMQTPGRLGRAGVSASELARYTALAEGGGEALRQGDMIHCAAYLNNGQWLLVLETNVESSLVPYEEARRVDTALIVIASAAIVLVAVLLTDSMLERLARAEGERNLLTNRVAEIEKMALIGRLAASVAHEINNPLQLISDQAGLVGELLDDEQPAQLRNLADYRQALAKIRTQIGRAATITRRLLGFSHAPDGKVVDTDINQAVEETIALFEHEGRRHRITFVRQFGDGLPPVRCDAAQLQQVVLNVLHNALDAIGDDGSITIASRREGGRVIVDFADTGPGLTIEALEHLYDLFFTTKPKGKGTGLGLYVSQDIMTRLGGELVAANRAGGGAVFSLSLPAVAPALIRGNEAVCMQGEAT